MLSCGPMRTLRPLCLRAGQWETLDHYAFYHTETGLYLRFMNRFISICSSKSYQLSSNHHQIINKSTNHIIYFINNQFSWYSKLYISCKILCNVLESMTKNSIINQAIDQFNQFNQSINSRLVFSLWLSAASCIKMVPQVLIGYISYTPGYKRSK